MSLKEVENILVEVLGVEPEEITVDANLVDDLAAESIDFVDIIYAIEQNYGLKISAGEVFPAFLKEQAFLGADGNVSDDILTKLAADYPHFTSVTLDDFKSSKSAEIFFKVRSLVEFIDFKQAA
uniref:acyl carrier protein n=1 Tax=Thaumasiovibrio occultus TaxID=1891184 RepID=UPI000B3627DA|nr:acyl carrier protein [Thaumasiovibrio occultus]